MKYVSTFEVDLGEARVTTPGPRDMSTEVVIGYGTGFSEPMDLDLPGFPGPERLFESDLVTDPSDLFCASLEHYGNGWEREDYNKRAVWYATGRN